MKFFPPDISCLLELPNRSSTCSDTNPEKRIAISGLLSVAGDAVHAMTFRVEVHVKRAALIPVMKLR